MKVYMNYADDAFKVQQDYALKMAKKNGDFDKVIGFGRSDIDARFYEEHKTILDQKKGGGYWLWKPYFILKTLETLNDGDYLFYSDSGAFFLKSVDILIDELEKYDQDIMGFELPLIEKQWTKQELFVRMDCDTEEFYETNQILASYMLIRKSEFSKEFFNKYLEISCDELNITDKYDYNILQNKEFIEHRHDQSIFSLLYKKFKLKVFKDPSQFGKYPISYGAVSNIEYTKNKVMKLSNGRLFYIQSHNENYGMLIYHNRKGSPVLGYFKFKIKEILYTIGLFKGIVK